jgi:hypothetical protein
MEVVRQMILLQLLLASESFLGGIVQTSPRAVGFGTLHTMHLVQKFNRICVQPGQLFPDCYKSVR